MDNTMMIDTGLTTELTTLMNNSRSSYPVFIAEIDSRKIRDVNETVVAGGRKSSLIGKELDDILYIEKNFGNAVSPAFFNDQWYNLEQETLIWEGAPHIKLSLHHVPGIPDVETLHSLQKMIGFLLHRLRSPLTGMQGYTGMINEQLQDESTVRHLGKINEGIETLFELLDDLESLQAISLKEVELNNYSAKTESVVREILSELPREIRRHITFLSPGQEQLLRCNPADLKHILSALILNAVEHAPAKEGNSITIEFPSARTVKISHNGNPIPKSIVGQLFFPFVTGKATKLGIGLTMAMLYAKRYKGFIFLTDNHPFRGVSFTFSLPPSRSSPPSII